MYDAAICSGRLSFYSLQKDRRRDSAPLDGDGFPLIDLTDQLSDFQETAALVANLDVVIGCDSAPAHLAAALGVPTWLALPAGPIALAPGSRG